MSDEEEKFSFDGDFQTTIVALMCRDASFLVQTDGLIRPEFFSNELEAGIAACFLDHFGKYRSVPKGKAVVSELIKDGIAKRRFHKGVVHEIPAKLGELAALDIDDREFVVSKVAEFARHQAFKKAVLDSVDLIDRGEYDKAEGLVKKANEVGRIDVDEGIDYFDSAAVREAVREAVMAGTRPKTGISTGIEILDLILYHGGWGRKELSLYMGGPKSGKTMALIDAALAAVFAGHNVLCITLEVSAQIYADRMDANVSETALNDLFKSAKDVRQKIDIARARTSGILKVHEYPTGTLTPKAVARLISHYKAKGIKFDLVVVDYADLMVPDVRTHDTIENSKSVYGGLRAIAQAEDLAMLSATQTNREGFQQAVQRMEHVSDDINKARLCDIMISINATEDEKARNERRLFLAASRNQESEITIRIQAALERAKFIARVIERVSK